MPELRKIETSAAYTPSAGEVVEYLAEEDGKLVLKVKKSDGTEETLSGGSGVDTSDATATAADVPEGLVFYGADGKTTGTMPEAILSSSEEGIGVTAGYVKEATGLAYPKISIRADYDAGTVTVGEGYNRDEVTFQIGKQFYKCASVNTTAKTWTGYKAVLADGAYSFATSATSGLTYGDGFTPAVGTVYSEDAMIVVRGLWQKIITKGLVFRASFSSSTTAETGQDMSDLPSVCFIGELDGKTCLVYDGTVSDSNYSKGKVSDERFAVGKGPFTVTSWVAKGDAGYDDAVVFWWMGDNSPVIFRGRWFNGYTMVDHRGSYGHSSVQTQNNEWVFLAASRTGNDVSVYINVELVSTISCSESFPEEAFHIMPGGSTVKYMRDFRFYNRALTADEIAVVMREGE